MKTMLHAKPPQILIADEKFVPYSALTPQERVSLESWRSCHVIRAQFGDRVIIEREAEINAEIKAAKERFT